MCLQWMKILLNEKLLPLYSPVELMFWAAGLTLPLPCFSLMLSTKFSCTIGLECMNWTRNRLKLKLFSDSLPIANSFGWVFFRLILMRQYVSINQICAKFPRSSSGVHHTQRAGHFRYFLNFSQIEIFWGHSFKKVNNLFLDQSYLKSSLPVKWTW